MTGSSRSLPTTGAVERCVIRQFQAALDPDPTRISRTNINIYACSYTYFGGPQHTNPSPEECQEAKSSGQPGISPVPLQGITSIRLRRERKEILSPHIGHYGLEKWYLAFLKDFLLFVKKIFCLWLAIFRALKMFLKRFSFVSTIGS